MYTLLLIVIYMSFISLGLPDALLGSAWPAMHLSLNVPLSYAGIISMIISIGTVVSSIASKEISKRFKVSTILIVSVMTTAISLFAFSIADTFIILCIFAIPYGLGAGAIDAVLNNFVATHYTSKHMNFLHAFWGIGAAIGPYIMGSILLSGKTWNDGYQFISLLQVILTVILILSIPLWKIFNDNTNEEMKQKDISFIEILKIRGVKYILIAFFAYCSMEATTGLWASSYLVKVKNIPLEVAASYASLFYFGITAGRIIAGFVANKFKDKKMIRIGLSIIFFGMLILLIPFKSEVTSLIGLVIVGIGCAPIYPAIIHLTPINYPKKYSQAIIGVEMACAYTGNIVTPLIFGVIAQQTSLELYPIFLCLLAFVVFFMNERANKMTSKA